MPKPHQPETRFWELVFFATVLLALAALQAIVVWFWRGPRMTLDHIHVKYEALFWEFLREEQIAGHFTQAASTLWAFC